MRVIITLIGMLFFSLNTMANISTIKGKIVDSKTGSGVAGINVKLISGPNCTTNSEGVFEISNAAAGNTSIIITGNQIIAKTIDIRVNADEMLDLGIIQVNRTINQDVTSITIDESAVAFDESKSQSISSLLTSSDDVYFSNYGFSFGNMRFQLRGYDDENFTTYINGINFNNQEKGNFQYSSIGGLNDAVRNRDAGNGLQMTSYSYGNLGGTSNIDLRPSKQPIGFKSSFALANRAYTTRVMGTYSTGILKNGWAFTASGSNRWAEEGNIKGTYYNSWAYLISAEKIINNHSISITTFGAPTERGTSSGSYQEVYDLTGDNQYNPNWGYQNGKKRNARVANSYEPTLLVSYEWKISPKTTFNAGVAGRISNYSKTGLNWYNAPDPRPDYYRNLPSYLKDSKTNLTDPFLYKNRIELWQNDPRFSQINWDTLYRANYNRIISHKDTANYILERIHDNFKELSFNAYFTTVFDNGINFTSGIGAKTYVGRHYKTLDDLLGGAYWMDIDQFSERDFRGDPNILQNDLNNPNRKIYKNDVFGYDYEIHSKTANIWTKISYSFSNLDVSWGVKGNFNSYYRVGNMKNGRAPQNSYGEGTVNNFGDISTKMSAMYKINGKNFIEFNGMVETRSPLPYNTYLSSRIKNTQISNLKNGLTYSVDLGYMFNTPLLRGRITGYYSRLVDQIEIYNFYNDPLKTFVNFAMTGVDKENLGIEVGLSAKVTSKLTLNFIGNYGDYRYINRPWGTMSAENGSIADTKQKVYLKNFFQGGMPQLATSISADLMLPGMWFINTNINYYDRNYISLSPIRRTASAMGFSVLGLTDDQIEEKAKSIVKQEKFASALLWDASFGKLIYFKDRSSMSINLSVQNILNNQDVRTGGFEQGRFDTVNFAVDKYPGKYYYLQGLNFFLNIGYKF